MTSTPEGKEEALTKGKLTKGDIFMADIATL